MVVNAPEPTAKQQALDILSQMPENVTLEDISEEMAILAALHRAQIASSEGRYVSHEEVVRRTQQWVLPRSGSIPPSKTSNEF